MVILYFLLCNKCYRFPHELGNAPFHHSLSTEGKGNRNKLNLNRKMLPQNGSHIFSWMALSPGEQMSKIVRNIQINFNSQG